VAGRDDDLIDLTELLEIAGSSRRVVDPIEDVAARMTASQQDTGYALTARQRRDVPGEGLSADHDDIRPDAIDGRGERRFESIGFELPIRVRYSLAR